ncbi:MAG: beta-galactosidase trimerization domain-containing protein [Draconibacterium sp.]
MPLIGAQIFIEPGQTQEEIDNWFRILKENQMPLCRIRMFESYMKKADGSWDFTLFDHAFRAADKYGIKILATFFPFTEKTDIGGFKFPRNEQHLNSVALFIKETVRHFKSYQSLYGWVLINEPGSGGIPDNSFAKEKYGEWLEKNPVREFTEKGYPVLKDLKDQQFLMDYNTWYLNWIANEIRKYDKNSHLHVNNHGIFSLAAEYDFPAWRTFLNSLGGSAHPSWHFGDFKRNQYALSMSANSEIVRSGAGNLPWIMTEIQGGNNTYSGMAPFCPTADEITQWLWITVATEAKGGIFWSLNPRASGIEAGEWALLTFQDEPSDRLVAAKKVAETLNKNAELFKNVKEINSGINLMYIRESMWAEKAMATPSLQNYEGRENGAVMKSLLGYFEAFSEMGINTAITEFGEFDFNKKDYKGEVIILANQLAIPDSYAPAFENFVANGGKLIVDGLTGFFDENLHNTMLTGFALESLFGGNISEFKVVDNLFDVLINDKTLPAHLWQGTIQEKGGEAIAFKNEKPVAIRNKFGKGETVWVPSLLGLGSRISGDYSQLSNWLLDEIDSIGELPVHFSRPTKGMLMKSMWADNKLITVIVNKSGNMQHVQLELKKQKRNPEILFCSDNDCVVTDSYLIIHPETTLVINWN